MTEVSKQEILNKFKEDLVSVGKLEVRYPDAQQPFVPKHAKYIADHFNWELVELVKVSGPFKDGKYHIIDGQHRVDAVLQKYGVTESIPARIYPQMNKAECAELFRLINDNRRRPRRLDLFRTAVTAGAEPESTIWKVTKQAGYTIGPKHITAVGGLETVHRMGGELLLAETLTIIREVWGADLTQKPDAPILLAFGRFLSEYPDASRNRLVTNVAKTYNPVRLLGTMKSVAQMERCSSTVAGLTTLVRVYNTGLKQGKLDR